MTDREFFLQRWEQEYPISLRVFRALPHDKLDFRPHHRGQLSTYIRPMGGAVPSIYGPSADDKGGPAQ